MLNGVHTLRNVIMLPKESPNMTPSILSIANVEIASVLSVAKNNTGQLTVT